MRNAAFKKQPAPRWKRNAFDLSHQKLLTGHMGNLIPFYVQNVYPNDKFRVSCEPFIRMAPLVTPVLSRWDLTTHYFYVKYRSIYSNWERFITGGRDGTATPTLPYITMDAANKAYFDEETLNDYLGLPVYASVGAPTQDVDINVLAHAAYQHIWDEYYADNHLCTLALDIRMDTGVGKLGDGDQQAQIANLVTLRQRMWEKDYFTTCRPWAQGGDDVELDLDLYDPNSTRFRKASGAAPTAGAVTITAAGVLQDAAPVDIELIRNTSTNILTDVTAILELPDLRRAEALQKYLEAALRGGTRYEEMMLGIFGRKVNVEDDIPKYLGGGVQPVQISEVMSNTTTLDNAANPGESVWTPVGEYTGKGISSGRSNQWEYDFPEHGIVLGIMSMTPRIGYGGEGIPRFFRYDDRFDFATPHFARIGEQEVLQSEIYWDPTGSDMDDTFGYQKRFGEDMFAQGLCHGEFRSTLDTFHSNLIFGAAPGLTEAFVTCSEFDDELTRMFAVPAGTKFYASIWNNVQALRPLPIWASSTI